MKNDTKSIDPLWEKVESFRREQGLYEPGQHLLLALSGGKDSVCLFFVLLAQRERLNLKLSAVTVHHGLRESAEGDLEFCRALCQQHGVDFYPVRVDAAAFAKEQGVGLEEAGRRLRYRHFALLSQQIGADRILTAHTASDQCETVLMHWIRGASLGGLCGIPPRRSNIVRPLLCCSCEEVLAALKRWNQPFCRDETNGEDVFFRNRVRHRLLPLMKEENPSLEETVTRNTRVLRGEKALLEALCEQALAGVVSSDGLRVDRERLRSLCQKKELSPLVSRVIARACGALGLPMPSAKQCRALCQGALQAPTGKRIFFSGGVLLVGAKELVFARESKPIKDYALPLRVGRNEMEQAGFEIWLSEEKKDANYKNINKMLMIMKINSATIVGGLTARNRKAGDRIVINGMHKSVKKLLCDCKRPPDDREVPVIVDNEGIVWVPGVGLCDRVRPREGEAYVCLEMKKTRAFDDQHGDGALPAAKGSQGASGGGE